MPKGKTRRLDTEKNGNLTSSICEQKYIKLFKVP